MDKNVTLRHRQRQIQQTETDFFTALCELLRKKNLNELTINDICVRAGYSRRTFYRHFAQPIEILQLQLNQLMNQLFDSLRDANQAHAQFSQTVISFFNFWVPHRTLLEILEKQNLFYLLPQTASKNIHQSLLAETLDGQTDAKFIQNFGIAGMFALLETWLNMNTQPNPQQMGKVARKIQDHLSEES